MATRILALLGDLPVLGPALAVHESVDAADLHAAHTLGLEFRDGFQGLVPRGVGGLPQGLDQFQGREEGGRRGVLLDGAGLVASDPEVPLVLKLPHSAVQFAEFAGHVAAAEDGEGLLDGGLEWFGKESGGVGLAPLVPLSEQVVYDVEKVLLAFRVH